MGVAAGRRRGGAKSRRLWFWRRRRQHAPVLIPPLDRLGELVDRVVTLLDEAPAPAEPRPAEAEVAQRVEDGHVLFVPGVDGYRLVAHEGQPPATLDVIELGDVRYRLVRVGPSPLPGDRRRCGFLEQEPPGENRTPTGARGEPDRRDESGPTG